jgi:SpoVK/Ycf46/Vps4 family AAA+-type ATPase
VLILDVGTLMGSLVGQTEERTRQALQIADATAPCVVMIDEVEKALADVGNSGQNDSGVSSRMFGSFLSWLNDHDSDVFVVCTGCCPTTTARDRQKTSIAKAEWQKN